VPKSEGKKKRKDGEETARFAKEKKNGREERKIKRRE